MTTFHLTGNHYMGGGGLGDEIKEWCRVNIGSARHWNAGFLWPYWRFEICDEVAATMFKLRWSDFIIVTE
jgi:hypothetical protein